MQSTRSVSRQLDIVREVFSGARRLVPARRLAVVLVAAALVSCGGDDDGGDGPTDGSQSPTDPPAQGGENQAPTIGGSPASQVLPGNEFDFTPTAADADDDSLTFTVANLPAWASFDAGTGRISGTPEEGDVGTYPGILVSVSDGSTTASLPTFSISVVATASGSATLSWTAPTQKTDGSPVQVAGYKIYWGTSSRSYSDSVSLDTAGIATYVVDGLTPATWYFAVTAVDSQGLESDYSGEATKQVF